MDRNEIIARLRHMVRIGDAMNACRTESNNVLAAAADLLEADGWVSVGERLPETREPVMAYLTVGRIAVAQWHKPFWDEDGRVVNVTHWRPLPTPPGGDHD